MVIQGVSKLSYAEYVPPTKDERACKDVGTVGSTDIKVRSIVASLLVSHRRSMSNVEIMIHNMFMYRLSCLSWVSKACIGLSGTLSACRTLRYDTALAQPAQYSGPGSTATGPQL